VEMVQCKSDEFLSRDKQRCCDRCPAGKYIRSECDGTKKTECNDCVWGYYTATSNSLFHCKGCRVCHSINNHKTLTECTATKNTQCECLPGFYCNEPDCELCRAVTICPEGKGVKVKASRTNDTICAVCENGTYSNVSDFHSPCLSHTRSAHTSTNITFKTKGLGASCPWILPASLWAGMVLMSLILLGILCWRAKRKCYKTGVCHQRRCFLFLCMCHVFCSHC
uniref:TNFR-Cys domain-containing protein n=1 Tax=Myripristis murdjan TaxID=586833 RepID=A0A667X2X7_9TELE